MPGFMVVIECLIFVYLQVEHSEQSDKENGLTILPNWIPDVVKFEPYLHAVHLLRIYRLGARFG